MDIQAILNKVLDAGLYGSRRNRFMCHAIEAAQFSGLIADAERQAAYDAIQEYIAILNPYTRCLANCFDSEGRIRERGDGFMYGKVMRLSEFTDTLGTAIYRDWASRPMP